MRHCLHILPPTSTRFSQRVSCDYCCRVIDWGHLAEKQNFGCLMMYPPEKVLDVRHDQTHPRTGRWSLVVFRSPQPFPTT